MCSDYLQYLRGAEVWRAAQYANPPVDITVTAIPDREGQHSNPVADIEEILRRESFHPHDKDQCYKLHSGGSTHTHVTEQIVEQALYSQSIKTAPGPEKLTFGAIRLLWKLDKQRIVGLMKVAICMGRHPGVWKLVSGAMIRKAAKDNIQIRRRIAPDRCWAACEMWSKKWSLSCGQMRAKEESY